MGLFEKFKELTKDRKVDYQIENKGKKKVLTFQDPHTKKREPVTKPLNDGEMDDFLSLLMKAITDYRKGA